MSQSKHSAQTGFEYQTDAERKTNTVFTVLSKLLKLSVAVCISVIFAEGDDHACGDQAFGLYMAILIVIGFDVIAYCISLWVLRMTPGCCTAGYLICYSIAKWMTRAAIISCGIVINVFYFGSEFDCNGIQESLMIFVMAVLDWFTVIYLLFGCCVACSCILACTGLTNTTQVNESSESLLQTPSD